MCRKPTQNLVLSVTEKPGDDGDGFGSFHIVGWDKEIGMRITLYEPALAVSGKAYAGWANPGDELLFPHVDTCCAVLIYGDNAVVGGHMGSQLPNMGEPNYEAAGRYVWTLVHANHRRLNTETEGCKVVTIGESNWYDTVVSTIWAAVRPIATLSLRTTEKFCSKGVDIIATMEKIVVSPCGTTQQFEYSLPDDYAYPMRKDIGQ